MLEIADSIDEKTAKQRLKSQLAEDIYIENSNYILTNDKANLEKEVEEEMWDTDSVVYEACTKVFGSDMEWRVLVPDIEIIF